VEGDYGLWTNGITYNKKIKALGKKTGKTCGVQKKRKKNGEWLKEKKEEGGTEGSARRKTRWSRKAYKRDTKIRKIFNK